MTDDQVKMIAESIKRIAQGDRFAPSGLEALGMALAGEGHRNPVGSALVQIAEAIDNLAEAVRELK
jgi:hypothetical protein